jgi:hypothetical protein
LTTVAGFSKVKAISYSAWGISFANDAQSAIDKDDFSRVIPDLMSPPGVKFPEAKGVGTGGSLGNIWRDYEDNDKTNKELENKVNELEKMRNE